MTRNHYYISQRLAIATYVSSSVCWSRPFALEKRLNQSICRLGETRVSPRMHVLDEVLYIWALPGECDRTIVHDGDAGCRYT